MRFRHAMWTTTLIAAVLCGAAVDSLVAWLLAFVSAASFGLMLICCGSGALIAVRLNYLDHDAPRPRRDAAPPLPRQRVTEAAP